MKSNIYLFGLTAAILVSCSGNRKENAVDSSLDTPMAKTLPQTDVIHTDTLQLLHFDGNLDYWYAIFLNAKRDTLNFVTDKAVSEKLRDKMLKVNWKADTLEEAGDNNRRYAAQRMLSFEQVAVKDYRPAVSEEQVLKDIGALEEVKREEASAGINSRPSFEAPFYEVVTSTENEDNRSILYWFRVYTYPMYAIRYFDPSNNSELSLEQWRKTK